MARPEITGRKIASEEQRLPLPVYAMTIEQFCETHNISRAYYYQLKQRGLTPRTMQGMGDKQLITVEEAARWREARTAEAKTAE